MNARIREIANIPKGKRKLAKRQYYNIFDSLSKQNKNMNTELEKKSTQRCTGLLGVKKKAMKKTEIANVFEDNRFLTFYVLSALLQIIHYESLNIMQYKDLTNDHIQIFKAKSQEGKILPSKLSSAITLYLNIVNYKKNSLINDYEQLIRTIQDSLAQVVPRAGISLGEVYSALDSIFEENEQIIYKAEYPLVEAQADFKDFNSMLSKYLVDIVKMAGTKELSFDEALKLHLEEEFLTKVQAYILFFTGHTFCYIDKIIFEFVCHYSEGKRTGKQLEFVNVFSDKICEKFSVLSIKKQKIEYDEMKKDQESFAGARYRRLYREMHKEEGLWFNKKRDKENKELFNYISKKYDCLLRLCPLHKELEESKRLINNNLNEFVKLKPSRDFFGRAQRMANTSIKELFGKEPDINVLRIDYSYLCHFYLKKILLLRFCSSNQKKAILNTNYASSDFRFKLVKLLFKRKGKKNIRYTLKEGPSKPEATAKGEISKSVIDSLKFSDNLYKTHGKQEELKKEQHRISKKGYIFEAELVTIQGCIFGTVNINSFFICFNSEKRREHSKYLFGSTPYNQLNKPTKKKWPLDTINEVVVKRYHLIYQAIEIYFYNSKSVFICFFNEQQKQRFIKVLNHYIKKSNNISTESQGQYKKLPLQIQVIDRNNQATVLRPYTKLWQQCKLSNFEYLMILNKYGGRSFNDLSQYPIFPWVIADYTSPKLSYIKESTYRNLKYPISGISKEKREKGMEKYELLRSDSDMMAPFQYGSHYSAARMVLGYLLRTEPFASRLLKFEGQADSSARMFHTIETQWSACNYDSMDNKELIPEFFYLPEMFANYNRYNFGIKDDNNCLRVRMTKLKVRVDQVLLPEWVLNNHQFIRENFSILESKVISSKLNYWIDLIFGESQQSVKNYNMFKELCDEKAVKQLEDEINDSHITEIQEFGSNPIRLFKDKHVSREIDILDFQMQRTIFYNGKVKFKGSYTLSYVYNFKSPIITIHSLAKKATFLLGDQELVNREVHMIKYKNLNFKNSESFKPQNSLFTYSNITLRYDSQRTICPIKANKYIITCGHIDNSCKIYSLDNSSYIISLRFHHKIVTAVIFIESRSLLLTAAEDGTLVAWKVNEGKTLEPTIEWYACDHDEAIVTLDANQQLDLTATGSKDGTIAIRVITTGKLLRKIKIDNGNLLDHIVKKVRLSERGYILVVLTGGLGTEVKDHLIVYSINGEKICKGNVNGVLNCIVMDSVGYQFIAGGNGLLCQFDLLSLAKFNLLDEALISEGAEYLKNLEKPITALDISNDNRIQKLIIGLASGELFVIKRESEDQNFISAILI